MSRLKQRVPIGNDENGLKVFPTPEFIADYEKGTTSTTVITRTIDSTDLAALTASISSAVSHATSAGTAAAVANSGVATNAAGLAALGVRVKALEDGYFP